MDATLWSGVLANIERASKMRCPFSSHPGNTSPAIMTEKRSTRQIRWCVMQEVNSYLMFHGKEAITTYSFQGKSLHYWPLFNNEHVKYLQVTYKKNEPGGFVFVFCFLFFLGGGGREWTISHPGTMGTFPAKWFSLSKENYLYSCHFQKDRCTDVLQLSYTIYRSAHREAHTRQSRSLQTFLYKGHNTYFIHFHGPPKKINEWIKFKWTNKFYLDLFGNKHDNSC